MIAYLERMAPSARWVGGQLTKPDQYLQPPLEMEGEVAIPFGEPRVPADGSARFVDNARLEDGLTYRRVLATHPKWVTLGTVRGRFPRIRLRSGMQFRARIGFLAGAGGSVSFQLWAFHDGAASQLLDAHKASDGTVADVVADLSPLGERDVELELRVDAGFSSGQDWAVWVDPVVESSSSPLSKGFRLAVKEIEVESSSESSGDDPALVGLYFRSVFGRRGSTKVIGFEKLRELRDDATTGRTYPVSHRAGLEVTDAVPVWPKEYRRGPVDVAVIGIALLGIEIDDAGDSKVREAVRALYLSMRDALRLYVEPYSAFRAFEALPGEPQRLELRILDFVRARPAGKRRRRGGGRSAWDSFPGAELARRWVEGLAADVSGHDPLNTPSGGSPDPRFAIFLGVQEDYYEEFSRVAGLLDPPVVLRCDGPEPICPLTPRDVALTLTGAAGTNAAGARWRAVVRLDTPVPVTALPIGAIGPHVTER